MASDRTSGCSAAIRASRSRARAPSGWKAIFRGEAGERGRGDARRCVARISHVTGSGTRPERVQQRRQAPLSRRDRRIRGWIADSALRAMADRKAAFAHPPCAPLSAFRVAQQTGQSPMFHDKPEWIAHQRRALDAARR